MKNLIKDHFILPDINDCIPNPCLHNGICEDGVNAHTCTCEAGYEGDNCEIGNEMKNSAFYQTRFQIKTLYTFSCISCKYE